MMDVEELRKAAMSGVSVRMSAADVLEICRQMVCKDNTGWVSLDEAAGMYRKSRKTLVRLIELGCVRGRKIGGVWEVESPSMRERRHKEERMCNIK